MPLPTDNSTFKQGDFSGYQVQGRCDVVPEFDYHSPFSNTITHMRPVGGGSFFALLDDPRLVDANGSRLQDPALPDPADTGAFRFQDPFTALTTFGIDGAILELPNLALSIDQVLQFRWCFLCYDTTAGGNNDFAVFEADDDLTGPVYRTVLAQANDLPGGGITAWNSWRWQPAADFHGVLRWVVSNGTTLDPPIPSNSNRARPSALLIDSIRILRA